MRKHEAAKMLVVGLKVVLGLMVALCAMVACTSAMREQLDDGYQFGDVSRGAISNLDELCDPENDAARMAARAAFLAATGSPFPIRLCDTYSRLKEPSDEDLQ